MPRPAHKVAGGCLWMALSLLVSIPLDAWAVDPRPKLVTQSWGADQGLPGDGVMAVLRTRDGYLWVGTRSGLARFDGVRFRHYGFRDGLRSMSIRALLEDQGGRLWVGTIGGGVSRLEEGQFTTLTVADGLPSDTVGALAEDRSGQIWVGTSKGLVTWRDGSVSAPKATPFLGAPITQILRARNGTMWLAVFRKGVFHYRDGKWSEIEGEPQRAGLRVCQTLFEDRKGRIWAGTDGASLFRGEPAASGSGDLVWRRFPVPAAEAFTYVESILEDASGNVWPSLSAGDPVFFANGEGEAVSVQAPLGSAQVLWRFADADGSLWGSDGAGLLRLPHARVAHYGQAEGLAARAASAVVEIAPGRLWVGAFGGGLFELESGRFSRILPDPAFERYYYVNALCLARDGSCWAGTGHGLHQFRDGKRILGEEFRASFDGDNVFAICEDRGEGLWIGTGSGRVWRWHAGKLEQDRSVSTDHGVMDLAQEKDGTLWLATSGGGLRRSAAGKMTRFGLDDGLASEDVSRLLVDSENRLWVGTHGGGLSWFHRGRLVTCTRREGLPDDNIWHILDDGAGHLWLGTNGGIVRLIKSDLDELAAGRRTKVQPLTLGRTDGLPSGVCARGAAARLRSGTLAFPTTDGVVLVNPSSFTILESPPRVCIEEVSVGATPHAVSAQVILAPNEPRRLEIRYTALGISAPEHALFRYRLEGLETDWNEAGPQRLAVYNQLPPGTYRFQVAACNRDGVWSDPDGSLAVMVEPHFWETRSFRGAMVLIALGVTGGMVAQVLRVRYRRRVEILERESALERERSRIAQDIHDDVGASLTQIGFLSALIARATATPPAGRDQVERIRSHAVEVVQSLDSIVWAVQPRHDRVPSLVAYLCQVADELFRDSPIRCRQDVPADIPTAPLEAEKRHQILLAAKEALHNAAKHSHATEVWLRIRIENNVLGITVTDNGIGFTSGSSDGTGLGNMQRRMETIGGTCEITGGAGAGTTVVIRIALAANQQP
jgi:ligand-binding sensor domain-containing protein/signal transduction histidine kinase